MQKTELIFVIGIIVFLVLIVQAGKLDKYIKHRPFDVELTSFSIPKPHFYRVCMDKVLDKSEVLFLSINLKDGEVINIDRSLNGKCSTLLLDSNGRAHINDKVNYDRNSKIKTSDISSVDWYIKIIKQNKILDRGTFILTR